MDSVGEVKSRFATIAGKENPLKLRRGGVLEEAVLAYETYGELNAERSNAVLVFHALSGSQHAAGFNPAVAEAQDRWTDECHYGWWDDFIGPGKAVDTRRFFVICANYLGGCYGSTGPCSLDRQTGRPFGGSFPWITVSDIVDSQIRLLDQLGIGRLHAAIGGSLGGILALNLATRYQDRVQVVIPIASGLTVTSLQRIHNFEQIFAIEHDTDFRDGDYYGSARPDRGLALARMIGHKTFVSLEVLEQRARSEIVRGDGAFGQYRLTHPIESYMLHQGSKFVKRFDANTYLCIVGIWQSFDLLKEAEAETFTDLFSRCRHQRYMLFSIDSDVCFYPEEQQRIAAELKRANVPFNYVTVHSDNGHDSFLLDPDLFAPHIRHTLARGA